MWARSNRESNAAPVVPRPFARELRNFFRRLAEAGLDYFEKPVDGLERHARAAKRPEFNHG